MSDPQKNTPENRYEVTDPVAFGRNMVRVAAKSREILAEFVESQSKTSGFSDPLNVSSAFFELLKQMSTDPVRLMQAQYELWQAQAQLFQATWKRFLGEEVTPLTTPERGDKRFRDSDWAEKAVFDFIKQSYLLTARWMQDTVSDVDGLDPDTKRKVAFYTKQLSDAISPSNFVLTNPEVLRTALNTNGESLVQGLENLLDDLRRGGGNLDIAQTDREQFVVGENLAVSPGKVVFQNDLMQLIQYDARTDEVFERPLLIFPPWINKFYILDLRQDNSFIKWATEQGYTVFVVSWVNPTARLANKSFEDYMFEGVLVALDAVEQATGVSEVNAIGYCIGGTLLGSTLAYMAAKGDDRIKSATFFAAQMDFSEAGDLQVFIDDDQLQSLEALMDAEGGVLSGSKMASTFNMLRSNDLIWSFVINNYMLGKHPFPFDLLYWNSDTTRMPKAMHLFYLRECYRNNRLSKGEMVMGGETLDLHNVTIPIYLQSSRDDHIAPYNSVYKATHLFGGKVKFMMAGSGHIAGVINHPDAKKYQYWTNTKTPADVQDWIDGATEHPGSWWPDWHKWLKPKSGKRVPARVPGDGKLKPIEDAPGSYVLVKS